MLKYARKYFLSLNIVLNLFYRVRLSITPDFEWHDRVHGSGAEPFWIWVEDPDNNHIYHSEYFLLHKKHVIIQIYCYSFALIQLSLKLKWVVISN